MSIDDITMWHQRARPTPTAANLSVQIGCHFEEVVEMIVALATDDSETDVMLAVTIDLLTELGERLKSGESTVTVNNRKEMLDSLADQIVTAAGVGHCASMNVTEAVRRVNLSNWSKYDNDGQPIFKPGGKIDKGPNYAPPDLEGLY